MSRFLCIKHRTYIHTVYKQAYSLFVALKFQEWGRIRKNYWESENDSEKRAEKHGSILLLYCIQSFHFVENSLFYIRSSLLHSKLLEGRDSHSLHLPVASA